MITSVSTATAVKAASERRRRERLATEAVEQSRLDESNASSDSEISALDDNEAPNAGRQDTSALLAPDVTDSASGHAAQANKDATPPLPSAASTRPAAQRREQTPSQPPPPQPPQPQSLQQAPAPEPPPARKEPATQHAVSRNVDVVLQLTRDKFGASARVARKVMEEVLQGVVEAADECESARTTTASVHRRRGPRLLEPQEIVAKLDNALRSPLSRQEQQVRDVYTYDLFEHNPNWAAFLISSTDKKAKAWEERRAQAVTCCEQCLFSRVRQYIYMTLSYPDYNLLAYLFGVFMILIILLNTITFCIESVPHYRHTPVYDSLMIVDYVCMGFFTTEYLLRLVCCPSLWRFGTSFSNFIDLVAILPFYIELIVTGSSVEAFQTRIVRLLRILRVLRIVKTMPKLRHLTLVADTLKASVSVLVMLAFLLSVLLVVFGTIFYFVEPSTFDSIPEAMYYAQVTLTTTGYGDIFPVTPWGRFVAGIAMLLCMVVVSLPIAVIGGNFSEKWADYKSFKSAVERSEQVGPTFRELKAALETHELALDDVIDKMQQDETSMERNLAFVRQELAAARAALDRGGGAPSTPAGGRRGGSTGGAQGIPFHGGARSVIRRIMSSAGGGPGSIRKTSSFATPPPAPSPGASTDAGGGVSTYDSVKVNAGPEELAAANDSNAQRPSVGRNTNGGGGSCHQRTEPLVIAVAPSGDLRTATGLRPRVASGAGDMEAGGGTADVGGDGSGPLQGGGGAPPRGGLRGIVGRVLQHQGRRRSGNGASPVTPRAGGGGGEGDGSGGKPSVILTLETEEPAAAMPHAGGGGGGGGGGDGAALTTDTSPAEPMPPPPPRLPRLSSVVVSTPSIVVAANATAAVAMASSPSQPLESVLTLSGRSRAGSGRKIPGPDGLVDRVSKSVAHFFAGNAAAAAVARTGSTGGQRPMVDAAELAAAREALNLAADGCARVSDLKVRQATLAALAGLLRADDVPEKLENLEEQYRALRCWQEELGPLAERMWCVRDALDTLAWLLQDGLPEADRTYAPASPEERRAEDEELGAARPGKQAQKQGQGQRLGARAATGMWLARIDDDGGVLGGGEAPALAPALAPAPEPVKGLGLEKSQGC